MCDKLHSLNLQKLFNMAFSWMLHWAMTQQNKVILPEAGNLQVFSATPNEAIQLEKKKKENHTLYPPNL